MLAVVNGFVIAAPACREAVDDATACWSPTTADSANTRLMRDGGLFHSTASARSVTGSGPFQLGEDHQPARSRRPQCRRDLRTSGNNGAGRFLPSTPALLGSLSPKEINEHMIIYSDMLAGWLFVNSLPARCTSASPLVLALNQAVRVVGDALGRRAACFQRDYHHSCAEHRNAGGLFLACYATGGWARGLGCATAKGP